MEKNSSDKSVVKKNKTRKPVKLGSSEGRLKVSLKDRPKIDEKALSSMAEPVNDEEQSLIFKKVAEAKADFQKRSKEYKKEADKAVDSTAEWIKKNPLATVAIGCAALVIMKKRKSSKLLSWMVATGSSAVLSRFLKGSTSN